MKKITVFSPSVLIGLLFTSCLYLSSCSTQNPAESQELSSQHSITFPPQTQLEQIGKAVSFRLPEGLSLQITEKGRKLEDGEIPALVTEGSVTCDCVSGNGECWPIGSAETVGCVTKKGKEACSECKMKVITVEGVYPGDKYDFEIIFDAPYRAIIENKFKSGEEEALWTIASAYSIYLDDIKPEISFTKLRSMPWANAALLDNDKVRKWFDGLDISENQEDIRYVPINVKGHLAIATLPARYVEEAFLPALPTNTKWSCSGTCGDGKCVVKSIYFGKLHYCDGCASGCTLEWE